MGVQDISPFTLRQLVWMLDGKRKYEYDNSIFLAGLIPAAFFEPKSLAGDVNPYSIDTKVELSEKQKAAKKAMETRQGMKLFGTYLSQFKSKKKKKV